MDKNSALRKIKACLRLAASSNPNEAAAALRQAQALMAQYGLNETDVEASEIGHADAPTTSRGAMVVGSVGALASLIADGFRCDTVVERNLWERSTVIRFYGTPSDAEIAAYAFTVLRRQMDADRRKHVARVRIRANKEARGEEFARGWVWAVQRLFHRVEIQASHRAAIDAAMGATQSTQMREVGRGGKVGANDRHAGYAKGLGATLNSGLSGSKQALLGGK